MRRLLPLVLAVWPSLATATTFVDVARDADVYTILQPTACGVGVSIVDVDLDDRPDILMADGPGLPVRLWMNQGGMSFQEEAASRGLNTLADGRSAVFGDYDNDGDPDLFLGNWVGPNQLYRNDGGTFVEVTATMGVGSLAITNGAAWGDVNNDGWLDLIVAVYDQNVSNILYLNQGGVGFTDVTAASGVTSFDLSFQPVFCDYDRDGDQDIFITNDKDYLNQLLRNDGTGVFTDVAASAGVAGPFWAMGTAIADFDHNATMDFYVTNIPDGNYFYVNDGAGGFTNQIATYGVGMYEFGWATEFFDYDNDMDDDLYVVNFDAFPGPACQNALFRNDGAQAPFVEVATAVGVDNDDPGFGMAYADLDGDGYLEIVVSNDFEFTNLFQSSGGTHGWLQVELRGTASNRFGVGAWIELTAGGVTQHREIRTASGYLSQSPTLAHFGLGASGLVDNLVIRWPSGLVQVLNDISVNQKIVVHENQATTVPRAGQGAVSIERVSPNPFNPRTEIVLRSERPETVRLAIHDAAGRRVRDLGSRSLSVGRTSLVWDATDDRGVALASGVYHLQVVGPRSSATRSLTLVR